MTTNVVPHGYQIKCPPLNSPKHKYLGKLKQTKVVFLGVGFYGKILFVADPLPGPPGSSQLKRKYLLLSNHPEIWQALLISPALDRLAATPMATPMA